MLNVIRFVVFLVLFAGGSYLVTYFISNTLLAGICSFIWGMVAMTIIITSSWGGQSVVSSFVQYINGETKG